MRGVVFVLRGPVGVSSRRRLPLLLSLLPPLPPPLLPVALLPRKLLAARGGERDGLDEEEVSES